MLKKCSKCKELKDLSEFNKRLKNKDGHQNSCRECRKVRNQTSEVKAKRKVYMKARNATPEYRAYQKAHRQTPEYKAKYEARKKQRWDADPMLRINKAISQGIRRSLKGNKNGRHTWNLLKFTLEEFKIRFKSLFTKGMSFENQGKWHLDHIKPISSFNFTSPEDPEFQECWALSNLQPLWAHDNRSKGAKYVKV